MELAGLINRITNATAGIDYGRKGFATRGKAEEGRNTKEQIAGSKEQSKKS